MPRTLGRTIGWSLFFLLIAGDSLAEQDGEGAVSSQSSEALFRKLDKNSDGRLVVEEVGTEHKRLFARLLRTADSDGDQQLSPAEFIQGLLPRRPVKPLVKKQGGKLPGGEALLLLANKLDDDGDRRIEAEEVPQNLKQFYDRILPIADVNRDGTIDQRELSRQAPQLSRIALRTARHLGIDVQQEIAALPEERRRTITRMEGPQRGAELLADPERAKDLFARLDRNSDGQATAGEVPEQLLDRFERLLDRADRNQDDQLSRSELMQLSRQLAERQSTRPSQADLDRQVKRLLDNSDQNRDGKLVLEEAPPRLAERFDQADLDGNAVLEGAELEHVAEMFLRRQRQMADELPARYRQPDQNSGRRGQTKDRSK